MAMRTRKWKYEDLNFPFSLCWLMWKRATRSSFLVLFAFSPEIASAATHPPVPLHNQQSIQIQNIGFLNHWQYGFQRFEHLDFYNFQIQTWSIFHNFWLHCICMSVPNHNKFNQKLDSIVWMCFRIACMSFFLLLLFWGHHLCNPNKKI